MPQNILLLIPVYDDWEALAGLLERIAALPLPTELRLDAVVVDDGSPRGPAKGSLGRAGGRLRSLRVLELARNLGHQGAIAVGLSQLQSLAGRCDAVLVMDADGEDDPADIPALLEAFERGGGRRAVFAQRSRRSEGQFFRVFYRLYRWAYRLLSGHSIAMGNFSLLPRAAAERLVHYPELWRHYPATVKRARLEVDLVPTRRAPRSRGRSKMNFHFLVLHGLGAISVHGDIVGVRSLVALGALLLACLLTAAGLALGALAPGSGVPAWSLVLTLSLALLALQLLGGAVLFSFLTLAGRSPRALDPRRDYRAFVRRLYRIF